MGSVSAGIARNPGRNQAAGVQAIIPVCIPV